MRVSKPEKSPAGTEGAQAIRRAVEVLRAVVLMQGSGATLMKVARATNISRSTTFRILRSLTEERLLAFDSETHTYCIGSLTYELGLAASGQERLAERWKGCLRRINQETRLTTYLIARSGLEIVCLASLAGLMTVRAMPLSVGQRSPLGVGAGSLAILASLDDDEVASTIEANAHKLQTYSNGRLTPKLLLERVATTRAKGFACTFATLAEGVIGIGLLVEDHSHLTQLAISVALAGTQISDKDQKRITDLMRQAIREASRDKK